MEVEVLLQMQVADESQPTDGTLELDIIVERFNHTGIERFELLRLSEEKQHSIGILLKPRLGSLLKEGL